MQQSYAIARWRDSAAVSGDYDTRMTMPPRPASPSFIAALRRAAFPLVVFWAVMDGAVLVLLNPLRLMLLERIVALGDDPFVGNAALISFALSPPGVLALASTAIGSIFVTVLMFGGTSLVLWPALHGDRVQLLTVFRTLAARTPALLALSVFIAAVALLLLLPVLAVALGARAAWLSGGDFYFYLTVRPPEFIRAAAVTGIAGALSGAAALALLLRLGLALPIVLLRPIGPRAALRFAASSTLGRKWQLTVKLAAVAIGLAALWFGAGLALAGLLHILAHHAVLETLPAWGALGLAAAVALAAAALAAISRAAIVLTILSDPSAATALPPRPSPSASDRTRLAGAISLLACAAILAAAAIFTVRAGAAIPAHDITITAHRAGSTRAPENTMIALQTAIADGADAVEIDVQETADGEIVLLHDTDLRRVSADPRFVWQLSLAQLQQLDAGAWFAPEFRGERIPTLRAIADAARGHIRLNVELKDNGRGEDLAARVVAVLRETGVADQAAVSSLDLGLLREVHRIAPEIKTGLILATGVGTLRGLGIDFVALARRLATPAVIRQFDAAGREVHVWGIDDEDAILQAMLDGAHDVIVSDPALAVAVRRRLEALSEPEKLLLRIGEAYRRALTLTRI